MRPKENKFQKARPIFPLMNDKNGQALAYVYCEDKPGRRAAANLYPGAGPCWAGTGKRVLACFDP